MSRHKKKTGPKNVDNRLGALRTDLDALQSDIKGLAGDAGDAANSRAHQAVRAAESVAERAYRLAEETASHMADDVGTWTNDNLDSARDSIRAQPLSALLLSLGIGAIIGAIFLRS